MKMKKFLNQPDNLVKELLEGFALAHCQKIQLAGNSLVVRAKPKAQNQVALVTLGGSGHEPALSGFVGEGLLDISVPGEIFAAANDEISFVPSTLDASARTVDVVWYGGATWGVISTP